MSNYSTDQQMEAILHQPFLKLSYPTFQTMWTNICDSGLFHLTVDYNIRVSVLLSLPGVGGILTEEKIYQMRAEVEFNTEDNSIHLRSVFFFNQI